MTAKAIARVRKTLEDNFRRGSDESVQFDCGTQRFYVADLRKVASLAEEVEELRRERAELIKRMRRFGTMPCSCFPWLLAQLEPNSTAKAALSPRKRGRK